MSKIFYRTLLDRCLRNIRISFETNSNAIREVRSRRIISLINCQYCRKSFDIFKFCFPFHEKSSERSKVWWSALLNYFKEEMKNVFYVSMQPLTTDIRIKYSSFPRTWFLILSLRILEVFGTYQVGRESGSNEVAGYL